VDLTYTDAALKVSADPQHRQLMADYRAEIQPEGDPEPEPAKPMSLRRDNESPADCVKRVAREQFQDDYRQAIRLLHTTDPELMEAWANGTAL
jgi:hypothetical protein